MAPMVVSRSATSRASFGKKVAFIIQEKKVAVFKSIDAIEQLRFKRRFEKLYRLSARQP
jgi:hypothetical protein